MHGLPIAMRNNFVNRKTISLISMCCMRKIWKPSTHEKWMFLCESNLWKHSFCTSCSVSFGKCRPVCVVRELLFELIEIGIIKVKRLLAIFFFRNHFTYATFVRNSRKIEKVETKQKQGRNKIKQNKKKIDKLNYWLKFVENLQWISSTQFAKSRHVKNRKVIFRRRRTYQLEKITRGKRIYFIHIYSLMMQTHIHTYLSHTVGNGLQTNHL